MNEREETDEERRRKEKKLDSRVLFLVDDETTLQSACVTVTLREKPHMAELTKRNKDQAEREGEGAGGTQVSSTGQCTSVTSEMKRGRRGKGARERLFQCA